MCTFELCVVFLLHALCYVCSVMRTVDREIFAA